jgi:hypothetical protein
MLVRNEDRVGRIDGLGLRDHAADDAEGGPAQDRIGQQTKAVQLDEDGCVPHVGDGEAHVARRLRCATYAARPIGNGSQ